MTIWVDADACPIVIKDILFRAADRVQVTLVANQWMRTPHRATHILNVSEVTATGRVMQRRKMRDHARQHCLTHRPHLRRRQVEVGEVAFCLVSHCRISTSHRASCNEPSVERLLDVVQHDAR
ncbi:MAG: hypothetical protein WAV67_04415 [Dokdonella sp.]